MRKRLTVWMTALFAVLLAAALLLFLGQSFSQTMERERQRTQMTEGLIYLQMKEVFAGITYAQGVEAARGFRNLYAQQGVELIFLYNGQPVAGAALPGPAYKDLLTGGRAALLDTRSVPQRYAIADPLNERWTMITLRDVSDLYQLKAALGRTALWIALGAVAATALLSLALASRFTAPVKKLTAAVRAMRRGTFTPELLPKRSKDETGTLSQAFVEMQEAVSDRERFLEREAQGRQRLLDGLAHEMRTPLCTLLGNARLLQNPVLSMELRHRLLEEMAAEIKRLSDLDSQLLKLTELPHEQPVFLPVNVPALLHETAARAGHQTQEVALCVEGPDAVILGDRALLTLLADNLALNAVRASAPGQTVFLRSLPNGFAVEDKGIGMTAEQVSRAQEPFYKADPARTRKAGGVGLGLSLCGQIARLHQGGLRIVSAPGEGTTVTFTTPLQPDADLETPQAVS